MRMGVMEWVGTDCGAPSFVTELQMTLVAGRQEI